MNGEIILLVLSDSHGRPDRITQAYKSIGKADEILFLGDGVRDLDRADIGEKTPICVRGNCDSLGYFSNNDIPTERMLCFGEYNILMTHGHVLGVKSSLERAVIYASQRKADVLLYGHTHIKNELYLPSGEAVGEIVLQKPLRVFSPGSIGAPREGRPSFGVITIRGKHILSSFGEI